MNIVSVDKLGKSQGNKELFENISFGIEESQKIALIGVNGCGKSTLLKIIAGKEKPDSGEVIFKKGTRLNFLEQIPTFNDQDTILEHVFNSDSEKVQAIKQYELCCEKLNENYTEELQEELNKLTEKLDIYKKSLKDNGFNPKDKKIAVFMHTYLGDDIEQVRKKVYEPFTEYLKGTLDLLGKFGDSSTIAIKPEDMSESEKKQLLDFAFERYFEGRTLMGTVNSVNIILEKLRKAGVTEIACLIDFGLSFEDIMQSLDKIRLLVKNYKSN